MSRISELENLNCSVRLDNNQQAFFELMRAGFWEKNAQLLQYGKVDYDDVFRIADEQSVIGLVTAGIEHVQDVKVPQDIVLQFIGTSLQFEQQNKALNDFIVWLIETLRKEDVYTLLVKGQGIAQCYEKPLWRASGDVDLLLSEDNYQRAKKVLIPLADNVEQEYKTFKHIGITLKGDYVVELHGTLHSRLSKRIDRVIDGAQNDVFCGGNVRSWNNNGTSVFLPSPDNDVIFVFTHILHHFFIEGIGLRQICDWCRLLWTYRDSLDRRLLENRIRKMELMTEWKAFAAFTVEYLGMPVGAMPLLSENESRKLHRKADHILQFVLESGNFGHNREAANGKFCSAWYKMKDFARHSRIFPLDSIKFFWHFLWNGVELAIIK